MLKTGKFFYKRLIIKHLFFLAALLTPFNILVADNLPARLSGYILLQVESHGEAWYVNPENKVRYFLSRPNDAFFLLRKFGLGISDKDLKKIPVGILSNQKKDTDGDGLSDDLEISLGTNKNKIDSDGDGFDDYLEIKNNFNPLGGGQAAIDKNLIQRLSGYILLQVERNGEAWYVNPRDNRRYFLSRPADALAVMRALGLGVSNDDLAKINASAPDFKISDIEKKVFMLINKEREKRGVAKLIWRDDLALVARRHSEDLAAENMALTGFGALCDYPLIHHEGNNFGLYHNDRLHNSGIYDFDKSAENIALMGAAQARISYRAGVDIENQIYACQTERENKETEFKEKLAQADIGNKWQIIEEEIQKRNKLFVKQKKFIVDKINWSDIEEVATKTVAGWLDSPGHYKNLINADYDQSGMGAALVNGYVILTQVFIRQAECGYLNGRCCQEEGYYPYCYESLYCRGDVCVK